MGSFVGFDIISRYVTFNSFEDFYLFVLGNLSYFNTLSPIEFVRFMIEYTNPFSYPRLRGNIKLAVTESGLEYVVYLPPDYIKTDETTQHPVMYYLHGATYFFDFTKRDVMLTAKQFETYWKQTPSMSSMDSKSRDSHDNDALVNNASPIPLIVAPFDPTQWSWWVNGDLVNMFDEIHNELIPEVESNYKIYTSDRDNIFISGFSMGGLGALVHGFTFQEKFGKIISWDGTLVDYDNMNEVPIFPVKSREQFGATFSNDMANRTKFRPYNPYRLIRKSAAAASLPKSSASEDQDNLSYTIQDTPVLLYSGNDDFLEMQNRNFFELFNDLGGGNNIFWERTQQYHSYRQFIKEYGEEMVLFLKGMDIDYDDDSINSHHSRDYSHRMMSIRGKENSDTNNNLLLPSLPSSQDNIYPKSLLNQFTYPLIFFIFVGVYKLRKKRGVVIQ